ncbi:MAG: bifunctional folylpolyglutamate synthase/dihydrofolate synthase [Deltaproteobacteria bacterium]|nr:bifunctional folylpolyglutamate synthase/dihydrofolate synthase [Deltaproteobacteria bacterium]
MNFSEASEYVLGLKPHDFHLSLGAIEKACAIFDHPERSFPSVHIAGTNGKGSTAAFLRAICLQHEIDVGLYTSPHLIDVRERIQIGHGMIPEDAFTALTDEMIQKDLRLTYFEFLTIMAFLYFREREVPLAIIETGLGGRLDATNVITPFVSILTPIGFDHMRHLGDTLAAITVEKCGIIKPGIPVVTAVQQPEVMAVIQETCEQRGCELTIALPEEIDAPLGLGGEHQRQNAACAVAAAKMMASRFSLTALEDALAFATWPGRLETVWQHPKVIVDGAHNPHGAEALAEALQKLAPPKKISLMFGAYQDKDVQGMLSALLPKVREIICVSAPTERGMQPTAIAELSRESGKSVILCDSIPDALHFFLTKASADDIFIAAGSLSIVAEVKKYFYDLSEHSPSSAPQNRNASIHGGRNFA